MLTRKSIFVAILIAALHIVLPASAATLDKCAPVLAGHVSSSQEGAMEGVLVTAKRVDSTIAVTVVTDQNGNYRFPAHRLQPGTHNISIRATGYVLANSTTAKIAGCGTNTLNLPLQKVSDVSSQISNAEWLDSFPGSSKYYYSTLNKCFLCHTLDIVAKSKYTAPEWEKILLRESGFANNTTVIKPVLLPAGPPNTPVNKDFAAWLATINLSNSDTWSYPLKVYPRPSGRSTKVIITEYDLPQPTNMPHDVIKDSSGTVWFDSFTENIFGKLDPKNGKVREFVLPTIKPAAPTGALSLRFDRDENLWFGMFYQAGAIKFDRRTHTFENFPMPTALGTLASQTNMTSPMNYQVDGKLWITDAGVVVVDRIDLTTKTWETWTPFKDIPGSHNLYDVIADANNNAYFTDLLSSYLGRVDAKTGAVTLYQTPTQNSGPRRGMFDDHGQLWFGEYFGNNIGMLDTVTNQITEYPMPAWSSPYDVALDNNGDVWTGSMVNDRVERLNPQTGKVTQYLLPNPTNIRRVFIDKTEGSGVLWIGEQSWRFYHQGRTVGLIVSFRVVTDVGLLFPHEISDKETGDFFACGNTSYA